jgi:hypothetical protein
MRGMPEISVEPVAGNGSINLTGRSGYAACDHATWINNKHVAIRRIAGLLRQLQRIDCSHRASGV